MATYDEAMAHIARGRRIMIKSYTRPIIIVHKERLKPGKPGEQGYYASTDRYARRWQYVFPMHIALI